MFLTIRYPKEKRKRVCYLWIYLRLLRTSTAAAATIMITAAPIAMYVVAGEPLVGGGAVVEEGEALCTGVGVGGTVWVGVAVGVMTAATDGAGPTAK